MGSIVIIEFVRQTPFHNLSIFFQVSIDFNDFELENSFDHVRLYYSSNVEGQTPEASLTGTSLPSSYTTFGNVLTLELETDSSVSLRGLEANIQFIGI